MKSVRVKAHGISYRQGWMEVAQVHPGFVNIEAWHVHPDVDISPADVHLNDITDEDVPGNTELELSVDEARRFAAALLEAIEDVAKAAAKTSDG